ncbi:MAG: GDSL-type esterase/lipase family protein [Butyrivibrio sp.]|nr:GDSL-type esterase/lipase family protein [Butyrivibrio sp.]
MKKWKKILQNCPYISALLITWIFMTAGSIGLMIYRDYGGPEKSKFLSSPFFAIIMEEEMHGMTESAQAGTHPLPGAMPEKTNADKLFPAMKQKAEEYIKEGIANNADGTDIEGTDEEQAAGEETAASDDSGEEMAEVKAGRTVFVPYTPVETNSVYYSDAGQYALTTEYDYTKVDDEYFSDAAFIGDSRTLGIADYSGIDADFYCESGMTIYKLFDEKGVKNPKTGEKVNLNEVLQNKEYGKIYIMLGLNELGYGNTGKFYEKYSEVVAQIREWQPQAVIFVMANLHVSQEKNNYDTEFNNINVNDKNAAIANLADGLNVFYIDCNPLFVDEGGFLKAELTFDGVHLYAKSYSVWKEFLMEHGVVRDGE